MHDGQVLAGRYLLGALLGRGGMADVHRAVDQLLDRAVAVKLLRDPAAGGSDAARFTAEARTLAGLSHRGLVTVLDAGVDDGRPFLVMELVEGPTLRELVARGPMAPPRLAGLAAQVADALAHVHQRGVVHRDVKPANVLLTRDDRALLADFGIARLVGDTVRHTSTGQTIGTAAYLAPEQVLGEQPTPAVDVYALGLVLLEALTGRRAFPGSPTEAALARLHRSPALPASLSPDWRHLVSAMTARAAEARPSATEVADELRRLAAGRPAAMAGRVGDPGPDTVAMTPPVARSVARSAARSVATTRAPARHASTLVAAAASLVGACVLTVATDPSAPPALGTVGPRTASLASAPTASVPSPGTADVVVRSPAPSASAQAQAPVSSAAPAATARRPGSGRTGGTSRGKPAAKAGKAATRSGGKAGKAGKTHGKKAGKGSRGKGHHRH